MAIGTGSSWAEGAGVVVLGGLTIRPRAGCERSTPKSWAYGLSGDAITSRRRRTDHEGRGSARLRAAAEAGEAGASGRSIMSSHGTSTMADTIEWPAVWTDGMGIMRARS